MVQFGVAEVLQKRLPEELQIEKLPRGMSFLAARPCRPYGGVDVVLNSLGGELLRRSWDCIAPFCRFADIGKANIIANNTLPMGPFDRNVTFSAVDLLIVHEEARPLMKRILQDVVRLFEENPKLQEPRPLHVFLPSRPKEAMRYLQGGEEHGQGGGRIRLGG
ncbi:polyketide synthase [Colletotrichum sojae]|uniref:Polyketide synthase n=1 Tax=Colletotrichum sojae TaxID=2175907 RepID=A0A8H6J5S0_9PEZI|nr:polyketide synthase [Colletotrichum sojae]